MRILWFDPGKSTGWAVIIMTEDKHLQLGPTGVTKDMTLVEVIDEIREADVIGYESFLVRPDKAEAGKFNWQSVYPEQVIGSLKTLMKLHQKGVPEVQQPSQRVVGYPWAGMMYKKNAKGRHWQDALAHAVYFAVKKYGAFPLGVK